MADYQLEYRWNVASSVPVLSVVITGRVLNDPTAIPTIIDQTHAYIDRHPQYGAVYIAYDMTRTERKLPLPALMQRSAYSPRVKRVAIIGARARTDEMAVLIMGAAKGVPYPYGFFDTPEAAARFLYDSSMVAHRA